MELETYPKHICFWKLGIFFWRLLLVMMTMMKMFFGRWIVLFFHAWSTWQAEGRQCRAWHAQLRALDLFLHIRGYFLAVNSTRLYHYFINNKSFLCKLRFDSTEDLHEALIQHSMRSKTGGGSTQMTKKNQLPCFEEVFQQFVSGRNISARHHTKDRSLGA